MCVKIGPSHEDDFVKFINNFKCYLGWERFERLEIQNSGVDIGDGGCDLFINFGSGQDGGRATGGLADGRVLLNGSPTGW